MNGSVPDFESCKSINHREHRVHRGHPPPTESLSELPATALVQVSCNDWTTDNASGCLTDFPRAPCVLCGERLVRSRDDARSSVESAYDAFQIRTATVDPDFDCDSRARVRSSGHRGATIASTRDRQPRKRLEPQGSRRSRGHPRSTESLSEVQRRLRFYCPGTDWLTQTEAGCLTGFPSDLCVSFGESFSGAVTNARSAFEAR